MGNTVSLDIIAINSASNILKDISGDFGALGAAAVTALGLATGAFTSLLDAGSKAEDNMARFNSLVDSSPLAKMKGEMLELADATAKKTRFDNDSIIAAEGQLAVYTAIGQTVFPDALKATLNLATYMQTDATTGAKTLGRALEAIGDGSLSLLVKQKLLTKEQAETAKAMEANAGSSAAYNYELNNIPQTIQDQVKALQDSGKMTEAYKLVWDSLGEAQKKTASEMRNANGDANAQAYVIGILNGKIGNLAEDMGQDFPGQVEILQNKLGDFWQEQGVKTEDVLQPLIGWFNILADAALPKVGEALDSMRGGLNKAVDALGLFMNGNFFSGEDIFSTLEKNALTIDWSGMLQDVISGFNNIDWAGDLAAAVTGLGLGVAMSTNFMAGLDDAVKGIDWKKVSDGISKGIGNGQGFNELGKMMRDNGEAAGKTFGDGFSNFFTHFDFGDVISHAILGFDQFAAGLAGTDMQTFVKNLDSIKTTLDGWTLAGKTVLIDAFNKAIDGVNSTVLDAVTNFDNMKKNIDDVIGTNLSKFNDQWKTAAKSVDPFLGALQNVSKLVDDIVSAITGIVIPAVPGTTGTTGGVGTGAGGGNSGGADFIVPPGYPNDTYPMRVESGEHVVVTPKNKVANSGSANSAPSGGTVLNNHGTIHVHLSGDKMSVAGFIAELGAAM